MPLIQLYKKENFSKALWEIQEPLEYLNTQVILSDYEKLEYQKITNKTRSLQWLAARVAIKHAVDLSHTPYSGLIKNDTGKPYLSNNLNRYISLSHSDKYAAAIFSQRYRVGIDIQVYSQKLTKLKTKFLSTTELCYDKLPIEKLCIIWSAKEAVYKTLAIQNISIKNINVKDFEVRNFGGITISIQNNYINVSYTTCDDYVTTHCVIK